MKVSSFDHVAPVTTDLDRSIAFLPRYSGFASDSATSVQEYRCLDVVGQLRNPSDRQPKWPPTQAPKNDPGDIHFGVRVADFAAAMRHLKANGYSEHLPDGEAKRLFLRLDGPAPFQQAFLLDPDNHVIEIDNAPLKAS